MGGLKRFINDPLFMSAFEGYIKAKLDAVHKNLEVVSETNIIFRLQGQAEAYKRLLHIRDEINHADKQ